MLQKYYSWIIYQIYWSIITIVLQYVMIFVEFFTIYIFNILGANTHLENVGGIIYGKFSTLLSNIVVVLPHYWKQQVNQYVYNLLTEMKTWLKFSEPFSLLKLGSHFRIQVFSIFLRSTNLPVSLSKKCILYLLVHLSCVYLSTTNNIQIWKTFSFHIWIVRNYENCVAYILHSSINLHCPTYQLGHICL